MNETFNNLIAYSPAPEALQEVKVLTANSPAEFGNVNGGGVVSVLKSGTNQFHGSAYGYEQNANFNANTWNNNHQTPAIPKNPFSQAQFGGTFGGPIKRDKLFFFVDYLGGAVPRWRADFGECVHACDAQRRFLRPAQRTESRSNSTTRKMASHPTRTIRFRS